MQEPVRVRLCCMAVHIANSVSSHGTRRCDPLGTLPSGTAHLISPYARGACEDGVAWNRDTSAAPTDIAREHKVAAIVLLRRGNRLQDLEPSMGFRTSIQGQSMPVEAPCQSWILKEPPRTRHVDERQPESLERRIGAPEALVASKVRQATIDANARACRDGNSWRSLDCARSSKDRGA